MSIEIICGKCGEKILKTNMLKPLKDILEPHGGKCPSCGQPLSALEFTLDTDKD